MSSQGNLSYFMIPTSKAMLLQEWGHAIIQAERDLRRSVGENLVQSRVRHEVRPSCSGLYTAGSWKIYKRDYFLLGQPDPMPYWSHSGQFVFISFSLHPALYPGSVSDSVSLPPTTHCCVVKSLGPSSQYPPCQYQQAALCSSSEAMLKAQLCQPPHTEPVLQAWLSWRLSTELTGIFQVLRVPNLSTESRCGLINTG